MNMLYITNGGSLQQASMGMALTEGVVLSKNAVHKRVQRSVEWLRWMAKALMEQEGFTLPKPEFLGNRDVILVDASDEAVKGSKQSDYRLHYAFDLFGFRCRSMEITRIKEGEKFGRYPVSEEDIYIADRIYCTMSGLEHVLSGKGNYVVRFKSKAFNLYDENGKRIELLPHFRALKAFEATDIHCFYKLSTGEMRPIRIVAMKKDAKAIAQCKRKMVRKVSRKQEKAVQADTAELNEYVVLATSLDYTNEQILELYRARWQVEQVFYRLKSLFGYGDTPNKRDDTARAWFYGKLLLAALCETILKRMDFPPELDFKLGELVGLQFMG
jgi:hypothetical protein